MYNLNLVRYGGAPDWEILLRVASNEAGRIEARAQGNLSKFIYPSTYIRAGVDITCYELFSCSYAIAKAALIAVLPKDAQLSEIRDARVLASYR